MYTGEVVTMLQVRTATLMDWVLAPEWLDVEQACFLSGYNRGFVLWLVDDGGVDTDQTGLIEKRSLWEYQEALNLVLSWDD